MRLWLLAVCSVSGCHEPGGVGGTMFGVGTTGVMDGTSSSSDAGAVSSSSEDGPVDDGTSSDGGSSSSSNGSSSSGDSGDTSTGDPVRCLDGVAEPGELCLNEVPVAIDVGTNARDVALADLNVDGVLDIAILDALAPELFILHGDGARGFAEPVGYPVTAGAYRVLAADFDLDGDEELVVLGSRSEE